MTRQVEAIVHGLVQGVNFRYYTQREAQRLGVVGWVANQRDGTVKVVAQGDQKRLEQLIAFLHHGSPVAQVSQVDVTWGNVVEPFTRFEVRWF